MAVRPSPAARMKMSKEGRQKGLVEEARDGTHFMNDAELSHELHIAARQAVEARARVEEISPHAAPYQSAVMAYLQAKVLHLSIVTVAQARQHEWLLAEVEDLKEAVGLQQGPMH